MTAHPKYYLLCRAKDCEACGVALPLLRSRRQKWCPECSVREQAEKGRARMMARYHADPEVRREERRRYREKNRPHLRAYQREYEKRTGEAARWKRDHPDNVREYDYRAGSKRRAQKRDAFVEDISREVVWSRNAGMCGICQRPVPLKGMHVDHIIPLARGGEHSYANTQPAHPTCNARKGAKLPTEMGNAYAA
jgi:5-methylcytosine-specific restriction endonuclease McrA